jgi:hypothetical protein
MYSAFCSLKYFMKFVEKTFQNKSCRHKLSVGSEDVTDSGGYVQ